MREKGDSFNTDCDYILFHGSCNSGLRASFKIKGGPENNRGRFSLEAYAGSNNVELFDQYFRLSKTSFKPEGQEHVVHVYSITLQPLDTIFPYLDLESELSNLEIELPNHLMIELVDWGIETGVRRNFGQRIVLPIHYIFNDFKSTNTNFHCGQCESVAQYACFTCKPSYFLCFDCAERFAREIHLARYANGHEMNILGNQCSECGNVPEGPYITCNQCESFAYEKSKICADCFSRRCGSHFDGTLRGHTFRRINLHPLPLREPSYFRYHRSQPMMCSECKSRVGLDFLKCSECVDPYLLCDRCADKGGIGKHCFHKFEYLVPILDVPSQRQMKYIGNTNDNPEAA